MGCCGGDFNPCPCLSRLHGPLPDQIGTGVKVPESVVGQPITAFVLTRSADAAGRWFWEGVSAPFDIPGGCRRRLAARLRCSVYGEDVWPDDPRVPTHLPDVGRWAFALKVHEEDPAPAVDSWQEVASVEVLHPAINARDFGDDPKWALEFAGVLPAPFDVPFDAMVVRNYTP